MKLRSTRKGYYTVTDPSGEPLRRSDGSIRQVLSRDECYERIVQHGVDGDYRISPPEHEVSLVVTSDQGPPAAPVNTPPVWTGIPNPSFVEGIGGTYNLNQNAADAEDTLSFALNAGSTALPSGVSLASNGVLTVNASATAGTTTGLVVDANDGTNPAVASSSFSLVVTSPSTARRWHPGHYLKAQGQPTDSDQDGYFAGVTQSINNNMNDSTRILGCFVGIGWGALNPVGNTYDWTRLDDMLNLIGTTHGKKMILQIQSKAFSPDQTYMAPSDLVGESYATRRGWNMPLWRDGSDPSFPTDVMGRYIDFWKALVSRYDSDARLEIANGVETAPSTPDSGTLPADYSPQQMADSLFRWYNEMASVVTELNFSCNMNSLGGGAGNNNQIPGLMEHAYQLGLMVNGPDAKESDAYLCFENVATGPVLPVRDYRGLMGALYVASEDVMGERPGDQGKLPAQVILDEIDHKTTHLAWIPGVAVGSTTWGDIIAAIEANTNWTTGCPAVYPACNTS